MKPTKEQIKEVSIRDVLESMERGFLEDVKPLWDELERHTIRRGNVTIIDLRNIHPYSGQSGR